MTMSTMLCRLCLNDSKLIDVFDSRLTNCEQLRKCILLGTGVEICREDVVTKYICHLCSEIAIFLYKYRKNAVANDKALKDLANQKFSTPLPHTKDIVQFNSQLLDVLTKDESPNVAPPTPICEKPKKAPQTNCAVHPTIVHLIKKYPRMKIPNNLLKYDIQPKILLDKDEVNNWKPPARSVTPVSKPVSDMERFKRKFPGINIMKISHGNENTGSADKSVVSERKRKISETPSAGSVGSVAELSVNVLKKKRFTEAVNRVKTPEIPSPVPELKKRRLSEVNLNAKIVENKVKIVEPKKMTDVSVKLPETLKISEPKIKVSETKIRTNEHKIIASEPKIKSNEVKIKVNEPKIKVESKIKVNEPKIKVDSETKVKENESLKLSDSKSKSSDKTKIKKRHRNNELERLTSDAAKEKNRTTDTPPSVFVPKLKIILPNNTAEIIPPPASTSDEKDPLAITLDDIFTSPVAQPTKPTLINVSKDESDTEKIIPKRLNKNKLFDSDTEVSDTESIGANDMPFEEVEVENTLDLDEDVPDSDVTNEDLLLDTFDEEMVLHCGICNKMFNTPWQLKCHERSHKNCTICKAAFRSDDALRHHHKEVCFKNVIANPPDVQLTRIEEQPEIMQKYLNEVTEKADETVLCISDDDDDVVLVGDSSGQVDLTQNQEFKYISNVFKKYKELRINLSAKTRYTEMKPQMHVKYNSKNQILLENMFPELCSFRVPVELIAKPTQFAYISFNKKPTPIKDNYSWANEPVITLKQRQKPTLMTLLTTDTNKATKPINIDNAVITIEDNDDDTAVESLKANTAKTVTENNTAMQPISTLSLPTLLTPSPPINITPPIQPLLGTVNTSLPTTNSSVQQPMNITQSIQPLSTSVPTINVTAPIQPLLSTVTASLPTILPPIQPINIIPSMQPLLGTVTTSLPTTNPPIQPINITPSIQPLLGTVNTSVPVITTNMGNPMQSLINTVITSVPPTIQPLLNTVSTPLINTIPPPPPPPPPMETYVNIVPQPAATPSTSTTPTSENLANADLASANKSMTDDIMELLEDAVPSTSSANLHQQRAKENLSLRVKTPWELNNI